MICVCAACVSDSALITIESSGKLCLPRGTCTVSLRMFPIPTFLFSKTSRQVLDIVVPSRKISRRKVGEQLWLLLSIFSESTPVAVCFGAVR